MSRVVPALVFWAMYALIYSRVLLVLDLAAWAAFTFMDMWQGQVLCFAMFFGLVAFRFGYRLGESFDEEIP